MESQPIDTETIPKCPRAVFENVCRELVTHAGGHLRVTCDAVSDKDDSVIASFNCIPIEFTLNAATTNARKQLAGFLHLSADSSNVQTVSAINDFSEDVNDHMKAAKPGRKTQHKLVCDAMVKNVDS